MSVELSGFDELISDLNNLGAIGNKIGRKAVEEGAKIVLEQQKKDAPRSDDNDHGADKLDITEIKKYAKSGTVVGRVGISSDNWEFTKGLYFNLLIISLEALAAASVALCPSDIFAFLNICHCKG